MGRVLGLQLVRLGALWGEGNVPGFGSLVLWSGQQGWQAPPLGGADPLLPEGPRQWGAWAVTLFSQVPRSDPRGVLPPFHMWEPSGQPPSTQTWEWLFNETPVSPKPASAMMCPIKRKSYAV